MRGYGSDGLARRWSHKREHQEAQREAGAITVQRQQGRLHVVAPFSEDFRTRAKQLGARWRFKAQVWSFPCEMQPELLNLLTQVYGEEKVPAWMREA